MTDDTKPKNAKPIRKFRSGAVEVSIWRMEGDKGPWYRATPRRMYKDGETWKDSDSFSGDDLVVLGKLIDLANIWIFEQQAQLQAA